MLAFIPDCKRVGEVEEEHKSKFALSCEITQLEQILS